MRQNEEHIKLQLRAFELLSNYLNETPDLINENMIKELTECSGYDEKQSFEILLAAACQLETTSNEEDLILFQNFFRPATHLLQEEEYIQNPYYKNIHFEYQKNCQWELRHEHYKPYEAFIYNDILIMPDGRQIPQIGFFRNQFSYPAVLENERIWMSITPNEIETMKTAVEEAYGKVLTFGLGLGYYAYMVSEKEDVESVTIVERDLHVIEMFRQSILPQFSQSGKIKIVHMDAFLYVEKNMPKENFDFVFTDLWHDVSDGIPLYLTMKEFERNFPQTRFSYWIENSMKCYM